MKEGALQKAHVLLKDDVVAFTDNKRDIMTVLFKFLQIYCIIATESSLQLNQKKKKMLMLYRVSKFNHITVDDTSHHNYTKSLN